MGSVNINFAEVEGSFDAMPAALYPVVIEKVEVRESKSSENHYFNWELTVSEGEHEGRKLWMITSLSPRALFRLKDTFEALGVLDDEMDLEWDDDVQITPSAGPLLLQPDVTGLPSIAVVTVEVYEGKERNRVDELRPIDEPGTDPAAEKGGSAKPAPRSGAARNSGSRRALR